MASALDDLIGKTVRGVRMTDDQSFVAFDTDSGTVGYECDGDCCSETWIADIINLRELIGSKVEDAKTLDLPEPKDDRSRQEEDTAYGVQLRTISEYSALPALVEFIYRNSSNGYYGGSLIREDHLPDGLIQIQPNAQGHWSA